MSDKRVLILSLFNLQLDEWFDLRPILVYYSAGAESELPELCDYHDSVWQSRLTDRNFKNTTKFFNDLQEAQVAGTNLMKFVWYGKISMWQFVHTHMFWYLYRTIELIRLLREIIEQVSPDMIRVLPVEDYASHIWTSVVKEVSAKYDIRVTLCNNISSQTNYDTQNSEPKHHIGLKKYLKKLYLRCKGLSRWPKYWLLQGEDAVSEFIKLHREEKRSGKKLLFATVARHWVIEPGQKDRYYDEQFYPIISALRKAGWSQFTGIDCPYSSELEERAFKQRGENEETDVAWRRYFSYSKPHRLRIVSQKAEKEFFRQGQILISDPEFNERFSWDGLQLMPILKPALEGVFYNYLPECARLLDIARQILKAERPDAVMATYEIGRFARALIIQAGFMGIPTVGLMHGMIFDNNYDYMHKRIEPEIKPSRIGFNVPKVTCVWGPFWKNNLTVVGKYPETAVSVTGNWRYDKIPDVACSVDVNKLKREFNVKEGNKVIAILAGGRFNQDYISTVLEIVSQVPEYTPLIKLHPSDDPKLYHNILSRLGFSENIIVEGRLIELLVLSDLVISQFSTVISEAALLQKPVIMVNLEKIPDWGDEYVDFGICLPVEEARELMPSIKLIFNDNQVQDRLHEARSRFIEQFFYKYDGCSAERVAYVVEDLINRNDY